MATHPPCWSAYKKKLEHDLSCHITCFSTLGARVTLGWRPGHCQTSCWITLAISNQLVTTICSYLYNCNLLTSNVTYFHVETPAFYAPIVRSSPRQQNNKNNSLTWLALQQWEIPLLNLVSGVLFVMDRCGYEQMNRWKVTPHPTPLRPCITLSRQNNAATLH